jgi:hypothetical protein
MTSGPTDGAGGDTVAVGGPRPLTSLAEARTPQEVFQAPTIVTVKLGNAAPHRVLCVCEGALELSPPTPLQGRSRSETYQSPRSNCGSGAFTWPSHSHWEINYNGGVFDEIITFNNAASIDPGDFIFI